MSVDYSTQLTVTASATTATVTPTTVAMNLKRDLAIEVTGKPDFSGDWSAISTTLVKGSLSVPMKINSVSFAGGVNTLTVRFPGAPEKGDYKLKVMETGQSDISNDQTLKVGATITAISPTEGSLNGETQLTITGTGFSTLESDMLLKLGVYDCKITNLLETEIKCVTPKSPLTDAGGNLQDTT